ncbi:MAG: TonB-dependent receptor [Bryobacteraceae bacterium]|nr:TonB-dependent receptor [Bryobacteraceae bacterium]
MISWCLRYLFLVPGMFAMAAAAVGELGEITGRITDPSSSVVQGAIVVAECSGLRLETQTNSEGRYTLQPPAGTCRLLVRMDGFAPLSTDLKLSAGEHAVHDFQLTMAGVADAITVTAGGFEQLVRDAPASVTIVRQEELQTRRVSDLAQALIDVEGVDVGQNVGKTGGLTISVRGMPSDYTLMLIDGRRQNAPGSVTPNGFGETATSFMPPVAAIERIEVVRGPMSTLYGSDAMGGVVNVITRRVGERWTGSVTLDGTLQTNTDYGNTGNGNFYFAGPVISDRLGLAVRGSAFRRQAAALKYEDAGGNPVPITSFGLSPTRADVQNFGGRLSYVINPNHDLCFDMDGMSQAYDNSDRQLGTVGIQGGYEEELKFRRWQAALSHTGRLGFGVIDTSFTRNTTDTLGRTIPPGTPGRIAGDPRTLEATNTLLDSKLISEVGGKHILSVGGQWWDADMIDGVAPEAFNFSQSAVFAEDEWRLLPKLALTGGVRYNYHTTFGSNTSPRAYLVYNVSPLLTLKGGVSRGFKTPQLNQLATGIVGFGGQGTIPLIGSPGLKPETSTSTEAGAALALKGVSLSVTLFNNQFKDKIAQGPGLENCSFRLSPDRPGCVDFGNWPNVDLFSQSINVDEAVTQGVETAMRLRLLRRLEVMNNYTYTQSEQRSGAQVGQPLVNTPKHMYNATTRYLATSRLNLWLRIEARSNRTRGTAATAVAATDQIGPFKGYGMAHLGGGFQLSRRVTLNAAINNLLNTDFLTYRPYVYNNATAYASVYNNLQEPRRVWMSLTYMF